MNQSFLLGVLLACFVCLIPLAMCVQNCGPLLATRVDPHAQSKVVDFPVVAPQTQGAAIKVGTPMELLAGVVQPLAIQEQQTCIRLRLPVHGQLLKVSIDGRIACVGINASGVLELTLFDLRHNTFLPVGKPRALPDVQGWNFVDLFYRREPGMLVLVTTTCILFLQGQALAVAAKLALPADLAPIDKAVASDAWLFVQCEDELMYKVRLDNPREFMPLLVQTEALGSLVGVNPSGKLLLFQKFGPICEPVLQSGPSWIVLYDLEDLKVVFTVGQTRVACLTQDNRLLYVDQQGVVRVRNADDICSVVADLSVEPDHVDIIECVALFHLPTDYATLNSEVRRNDGVRNDGGRLAWFPHERQTCASLGVGAVRNNGATFSANVLKDGQVDLIGLFPYFPLTDGAHFLGFAAETTPTKSTASDKDPEDCARVMVSGRLQNTGSVYEPWERLAFDRKQGRLFFTFGSDLDAVAVAPDKTGLTIT